MKTDRTDRELVFGVFLVGLALVGLALVAGVAFRLFRMAAGI